MPGHAALWAGRVLRVRANETSRVIESETSWTIEHESSGGQSGSARRPALSIAPAAPAVSLQRPGPFPFRVPEPVKYKY